MAEMSHSEDRDSRDGRMDRTSIAQETAKAIDEESRVVLAGFDALHEQIGHLLTVLIPAQAQVMLVGVGSGFGLEFLLNALPRVYVLAIDPSPTIVDLARRRLRGTPNIDRVSLICGDIGDVGTQLFDAVITVGVLHNIEGDVARSDFVIQTTKHLRMGAPLIVGCQSGSCEDSLLFQNAISRRIASANISRASKAEIARVLEDTGRFSSYPRDSWLIQCCEANGLSTPRCFFQSLLFKSWIGFRRDSFVPSPAS